jgi:transposase
MTFEEQNNFLIAENKHLRNIVIKLETRISELEELLRKANIFKDSSNSSKAPSTDISIPKRNQSLREPSDKKSGGQPGHKGTTLRISDDPDEIIELNPNFCNKCGCDLKNEESRFESKRQEIDIPQIQLNVKEYRRNSKKCPRCGNHQKAKFPKGINNNVQYGPNIKSAVSYLSVYQYLPYKRMKECMKHFFKLCISEGTINNILRRMSAQADPVYKRIKETISKSKEVGSDETSVKVNGEKWWLWVWQSIDQTYLSSSKSRGSKAIEDEFPDGFKDSILTTDRWAAQLKTEALSHQICIAHLLRDLKYLEQLEKNEWSIRMKQVLKEALNLIAKYSEYSKNDVEAIQLEQRLDILLKEEIPKMTNPKTLAFQKSLIKHRDSIFTFLYNKDTPADNNGSERAIRNVKVKQKVSGQFKTDQQAFCVMRSVIDTCIKRGVDVMFVLRSIAKLVPAE